MSISGRTGQESRYSNGIGLSRTSYDSSHEDPEFTKARREYEQRELAEEDEHPPFDPGGREVPSGTTWREREDARNDLDLDRFRSHPYGQPDEPGTR